jgi:serine/threonine-protein kinase
LKLIRPDQDPERIRREVLAVSNVSSKRVPKIHATGIVNIGGTQTIWIIEQCVDGMPLREAITASPLTPDAATLLAVQLLEALSDAEKQRIVHRDVKPENVIKGKEGNFWLIDFGIARHLGLRSLTPTNALGGIGTAGYAPPEQYQNRKREIDGRADLFALGVTLYEALTGIHPFWEGSKDAKDTFTKIEAEQFPRLTPKAVPHEQLREFIHTLMHTWRDQRPKTVADALAWAIEIQKKTGGAT